MKSIIKRRNTMDLQLRKTAARHAKCYRSYKAYLSGFEDAQPSELFETEGHRIKAGWVTAVEMVQKRLLAADPEKAMVFSRLFQLESGSRCRRNEVIRLSMELHVSTANIYKWRESILDELLLAATQLDILQPF